GWRGDYSDRADCALSVSSACCHLEQSVGLSELALVGTAGSHSDLDSSHAGGDDGADLEKSQADGAAGSLGEAGMAQPDAAQGTEQDIGHRGQPQAELVGAHG